VLGKEHLNTLTSMNNLLATIELVAHDMHAYDITRLWDTRLRDTRLRDARLDAC
jgi:hypothetical protein